MFTLQIDITYRLTPAILDYEINDQTVTNCRQSMDGKYQRYMRTNFIYEQMLPKIGIFLQYFTRLFKTYRVIITEENTNIIPQKLHLILFKKCRSINNTLIFKKSTTLFIYIH